MFIDVGRNAIKKDSRSCLNDGCIDMIDRDSSIKLNVSILFYLRLFEVQIKILT